MMAKKLTINGVDASYETSDPDIDAPDIPEFYKQQNKEEVASGFQFWGGPPKKPRRAWRDAVSLKKKFRDEEQAKKDLERNKKTAAERARIEYQASLNMPSNNWQPAPVDQADENKFTIIFTLIVLGGFGLACLLGFAAFGPG